jgi:hypothetical protein
LGEGDEVLNDKRVHNSFKDVERNLQRDEEVDKRLEGWRVRVKMRWLTT